MELSGQHMVDVVKQATADWALRRDHDRLPRPGQGGQITLEPVNLGKGWLGFDFAAAFGKPVKIINDAAMQALGSYQGGHMLFLGLGTGPGDVHDLRGGHRPDGAGAPALQEGRGRSRTTSATPA